MKKLCTVLLLLTMLAALAACGSSTSAATPAPAATAAPAQQATPAPTEVPTEAPAAEVPIPSGEPEVIDYIDPEAFVGSWVYSRARLEIARQDEGYKCVVSWGSSAAEFTRWVYDCFCDGDGLYSFETGTKTNYIFAEDGSVKESEVVFSDGAARFDFNEDGTVRWTDFKEYPDAGEYDFERVDQAFYSPTPEQIADEYFRVVGCFHSGTAGGSLGKAVASVGVLRFAYSHNLWAEPSPILRSAMLEAWESLSDDERAIFKDNFPSVAELIADCTADWNANRGRFEDAGVDTDMEWFLLDPITMLAWNALAEITGSMSEIEKSP